MNLTQDEIMALMSTELMIEWDKLCDKIKASRGGQYPPDWYQVVIVGGIWNNPSTGSITITTF